MRNTKECTKTDQVKAGALGVLFPEEGAVWTKREGFYSGTPQRVVIDSHPSAGIVRVETNDDVLRLWHFYLMEFLADYEKAFED